MFLQHINIIDELFTYKPSEFKGKNFRMKKIKKIISIGSLSSLLLMPLVAASCKKNDNDEKVQIINNESNPQTSKQMTPPILLMIMMISLIKMRKQTIIKI
nr:variable surface lipoprotein [Mycoplasmopsis bovis]